MNSGDPLCEVVGRLRTNMLAVGVACALTAGSAHADTSQILTLSARDMVYDWARQRIYASIASTGTTSVVPIDPTTGSIGSPLYVGEIPGKLSLTDDGHFLYVGLIGAKAVQRIDLETLVPDVRFSLGSEPIWGARSFTDLEAVPGAPHSVAVAATAITPRIAIYDDGVERPQAVSVNANDLAFAGSASQLDVCDRTSSATTFYRLNVGPNGVSVGDNTSYVLCSAGGGMRYDSGRFYSDGGAVLDPVALKLVGRYVAGGGPFVPDPTIGRAFGVTSVSSSGLFLYAYDLKRFVFLGSTKINGTFATSRQVIRWGDDGLAVRTDSQLVLIRSALVRATTSADVSLAFAGNRGPVVVGQTLTYEVTVHNGGPARATGVAVNAWLGVSVVSASPGCTAGTFNVDCALGALESGETRTIEIVGAPGTADRVTATASVTANEPDDHPADNSATQSTLVNAATAPDRLSVVDLNANGLAYDPTTGRLLASVGGRDPRYGNSVCAIDPATGLVVATLDVGSEPASLALSDETRTLYVALNGLEAVRRVDLDAWMAGAELSLGRSPYDGGYIAQDLQAVPGDPLAVAVARKAGNNPYAGVAVYDDAGVRRHVANVFANRIEFGMSASALYGYEAFSSGEALTRMLVDADGVTVRDSLTGLISGEGDIKFDQGRIYATGGAVVDPEAPRRWATLPGTIATALWSQVAADGSVGRTYIAPSFSRTAVRFYDQHTFEFLGVIYPPGSWGDPVALVRVGAQGLAFATTQGGILLIDSPLVASVPTSADLSVVQQDQPDPTVAGDELTYRITVSNQGPAVATGVVVTDTLPAGATPVTTTDGCAAWSGVVRCALGTLPPGASVAARITLRPTIAGPAQNTVVVAGNEPDPRPLNNTDVQTTRVVAAASFDRLTQLDFKANDLVYDPGSRRLFASVGGLDTHFPNQVVAIDPFTGRVAFSVFAGSEPGKLALSDDGKRLYVAQTGGTTVVRFDLPGLIRSLEFPFTDSASWVDLAVLPGQPESVAIDAAGTARVYDDGVPRATPGYPGNVIEFGASAARLYGYTGQTTYYGFARMDVGAQGITPVDITQNLISGFNVDIRYDRGLLFTSNGAEIEPESRTRLGTFPGSATTSVAVAPDPVTERVFLLEKPYDLRLAAFDRNTFAELGTLALPTDIGYQGKSLVRWGSNGLAFLTTVGHVLILRTTLVPAPDADGDGIPDKEDVCPTVPDPAQADSDGDGVGDACESEICNGVDDDGDGRVDEGCDDDGDGYCEARMIVLPGAPACPNGGGDCADDNPNVHPGAREACNGLDDNCDGRNDEPFEDARILAIDKPGLGEALLSFAAPDAPKTYDVVRGGLSKLLSTHGDFSAATSDCLANDATASSLIDDVAPDPGDGFWYLVRVRRLDDAPGTYDAVACFQSHSRDASIQFSAAACP